MFFLFPVREHTHRKKQKEGGTIVGPMSISHQALGLLRLWFPIVACYLSLGAKKYAPWPERNKVKRKHFSSSSNLFSYGYRSSHPSALTEHGCSMASVLYLRKEDTSKRHHPHLPHTVQCSRRIRLFGSVFESPYHSLLVIWPTKVCPLSSSGQDHCGD